MKVDKTENVVRGLTLTLGEVPQWCFLIDPVLVDGIDVVLRRLQGAQFSAQMAVLTAVRAPGAWTQRTRKPACIMYSSYGINARICG